MKIKELTNALDRKVEERKKEEELEKKEKENLRKERETESKKIDSKLKLLNFILNWAKGFSSTKEFKKILHLNHDDSVMVFYSKWAYIGAKNDDVGCWARVYLYKDGSLEYRDGYKWMGFRKSFYFNKNILNEIKYSYLKYLYEAIISKKVYDIIRREIEED